MKREGLLKHYGTPDGRTAVTARFDSLNIRSSYDKQESVQYQLIESKLNAIGDVPLRASFGELLAFLFKKISLINLVIITPSKSLYCYRNSARIQVIVPLTMIAINTTTIALKIHLSSFVIA